MRLPSLANGHGHYAFPARVEHVCSAHSLSHASPDPHTRRALQLLILTLAASAAAYTRFTIAPLQESIRIGLDLTDNQLALIQGPAIAIPMVMVSIPLGLLVDRACRVRILLALGAVDLIGSLLTALAPDFALLIAARALIGMAAGGTNVAALSLVADYFAPHERGRANMVMSAGEVGAASAAFALGGLLLSLSTSAHESWRWANLWLSAPLIPVLLLLISAREPARTGRVARSPSARTLCRMLYDCRSEMSLLLTARTVGGIAEGAALIWATPALSRQLSLSAARVGAIMGSCLLVAGLLGPLVGGVFADTCQRFGGPSRTVSLMIALSAICLPASLFPVMHSTSWATGLLMLYLTTCDATVVMVVTLSAITIPNEVRGFFFSVLFATGILFGLGLAPIAVSLVSQALGGPAMIGKALASVCFASSLFSVIVFSWGVTHVSPKTF